MSWIRSHPRLLVAGMFVGGAIVGYLAIGVFGVHTLFVDETVDEAGPVFTSGAAPSGIPSDDMTEPEVAEMNETMEKEGTPLMVEVADTEPEMPQIVTLVEGSFVPRSHPGEGRAVVLTDGSSERFLRFEDFETDNGPDLNVYLSSADAAASVDELGADIIDLGDLKGNVGSQNYAIPEDVDLEVYDTVVVWCVRFGVAFTAADLAAA